MNPVRSAVASVRSRPVESILFGVIIVSFVVVCAWLNMGKDLWLDELFTWHQVKGKSWRELNDAIASGFNLLPAGHFLVLWLLDQCGAFSRDVARWFSITSGTGALVVFGLLWRRVWGGATALLLTAIAAGSSMAWLSLSVEMRPYAPALFFSAIALKCEIELVEHPGRRVALMNAVCSFLLPFFSYPAGVYSLTLLLAYLLSCRLLARSPALLALGSFALGWLLFALVSVPALLQQIGHNSVGLQHASPRMADAFAIYPALVEFPLGIILVLAVARLFPVSRAPAALRNEPSDGARILLVPLILWLAVPGLFFMLAKTSGVTVFETRYFLPSAAALIGLAGALLHLSPLRPWLTVAAVGSSLLPLALHAVSLRSSYRDTPVRRFLAEVPVDGTHGPLIVSELNTFFHLIHYGPGSLDVRYYSDASTGIPLGHHPLGPRFAPVPSAELLQQHKLVLLVDANDTWSRRLLDTLRENHFRVIERRRPATNDFIKEFWYLEKQF